MKKFNETLVGQIEAKDKKNLNLLTMYKEVRQHLKEVQQRYRPEPECETEQVFLKSGIKLSVQEVQEASASTSRAPHYFPSWDIELSGETERLGIGNDESSSLDSESKKSPEVKNRLTRKSVRIQKYSIRSLL